MGEFDQPLADARAEGYAAAIQDVREAINESLNLAHLRESLRYLGTPPAPTTPTDAAGGEREGL